VNHTRAYPRCVVWRGAMWPRLDSIRVAAADRCVAMTTLPPPVIQLPPRTPLSRPLPLPRRRRTLPSLRHPPDGWVDGWVDGCPLIAPFVTSSTVIVSHHDPLRGSVSRGIATRTSTLHATSSDPNRRLPETHCPRSSSLMYSSSLSPFGKLPISTVIRTFFTYSSSETTNSVLYLIVVSKSFADTRAINDSRILAVTRVRI